MNLQIKGSLDLNTNSTLIDYNNCYERGNDVRVFAVYNNPDLAAKISTKNLKKEYEITKNINHPIINKIHTLQNKTLENSENYKLYFDKDRSYLVMDRVNGIRIHNFYNSKSVAFSKNLINQVEDCCIYLFKNNICWKYDNQNLSDSVFIDGKDNLKLTNFDKWTYEKIGHEHLFYAYCLVELIILTVKTSSHIKSKIISNNKPLYLHYDLFGKDEEKIIECFHFYFDYVRSLFDKYIDEYVDKSACPQTIPKNIFFKCEENTISDFIKINNTKLLGKGGHGQVFELENNKLAVKIVDIKTDEDPYSLNKLYKEYRIGKIINHPLINKTHELFIKEICADRFTGYLVMDKVNGKTLFEINKIFSNEDIKKFINQVKKISVILFKKNICWNDAHKENIFIDKKNNLKLIDFGKWKEEDINVIDIFRHFIVGEDLIRDIISLSNLSDKKEKIFSKLEKKFCLDLLKEGDKGKIIQLIKDYFDEALTLFNKYSKK